MAIFGVFAVLGVVGLVVWLLRSRGGGKPTAPVARGRAAAPGSARPAGSGLLVETKGYRRPVVGEASYVDALLAIAGGYARDGHDIACRARLVLDDANPHDPQAVRVEIRDSVVGYLPREAAARFRSELAKLGIDARDIEVGARITGGWRTNAHDRGDFSVNLNYGQPLKRA